MALVAFLARESWTFIGLDLFDVIFRAMRDGKAPFGIYTARLEGFITLLLRSIGSRRERCPG